MPELILAIDAGTTTARVALFSPAGRLEALARAPLVTQSPAPGRMEQDAQGLWRKVRRLIGTALEAAGRAPADVAAIGVATQRTSAVLWDRRSGRPLTPLVLWSDLRGAERARSLAAAGFPLAPQQAATKLEAMLAGIEGAGALLGEGRLACGGVDAFLIWKLSGGAAHVTDASQAWPTGYYDLAGGGWNVLLLAAQELDERIFPRLAPTYGPVATAARRVFGAEVVIASDIADQQAALVAHGALPGVAKVTFGTSATADLSTGPDLVLRTPATPPFIVSRVGGETRFCLEAMVLSAGAALDWLAMIARLGGHAEREALAGSVADAAGAVFLPALAGLGAPAPDPARTALIAGLTGAVSRAHLARAGMEGVAFRVREALDALFAIAGAPGAGPIGVDGGLSASDVLMQIVADLTGRPMRRYAIAEATAAGAALLAGRGAGLLTAADEARFVRHGRTFAPRLSGDEAAARHALWRAIVYGTATKNI